LSKHQMTYWPDDQIVRGQTFSSGHWVSEFFDKFIGYRTTDFRHL